MKTITLRAFRVAIGNQTEPVTVVKREAGEVVTLGTWTPLNVPQAIHAVTEAWKGRPAPKPSKR